MKNPKLSAELRILVDRIRDAIKMMRDPSLRSLKHQMHDLKTEAKKVIDQLEAQPDD